MNKQQQYKLIGIDLDGTLLDSQKFITQTNKDALKKLREYGCDFAVITGRHWKSAVEMYKSIGLTTDYIACSNGGVILNGKTLEMIHKLTLNPDHLKEIIPFLLKKGLNFVIADDDTFWCNTSAELSWADDYANKYGISRRNFPESDTNFNYNNFYKLTVWPIMNPDFSENAELIKELEDKFSKYFEFSLTKIHMGGVLLELSPMGANKGEALKKICKLKNIEITSSMAVGDSGNDVAMFKVAHMSFAPKNSTDRAKKAAKLILSTTNDEHIINEIIEVFYKNSKN